jgi:hypothetical protein
MFLCSGLLAACSSGRNPGNAKVTPDAVATIRKGMTTKEQVRAVLGPPLSTKTQLPIHPPPGAAPLPAKLTAAEVWGFWNGGRQGKTGLFSTAPPVNTGYTVIIFFNEQGIVLDYQAEGTLS